MDRTLPYFALFVVFVWLTGCSGSSETTGGSGSNTYRTSFPTTSQVKIARVTRDALVTRYSYRLQRDEITPEDLLFETEWKDQTALQDEIAQGYGFARTRITITARPRTRSGPEGTTYAARFFAETELRMQGGLDWERVSMTPMREAYIKDIADYLKNEILRTR